MKRSLLLPIALLAAAACSETSTGPGGTSPLTRPSFSSAATFTAVYPGGGACQSGPGSVNCNIYLAKEDVALNAGPSGAALVDGQTYYFAVLSPGGQPAPEPGAADLLSSDNYTERMFSFSGGALNYSGGHDVNGDLIRLMPYNDTPNKGGVYILAICSVPADYDGIQDIPASDCKYDAFKVRGSTGCVTDCPAGNLDYAVLKYYDANTNGVRDNNEVLIAGWTMLFRDKDLDLTLDFGSTTANINAPLTFSFPTGNYEFTELLPASGWFNTDPGTLALTKDAVAGQTVEFGNACVGAGGGLTLGFWSNRNGQALVGSTDLALLVSLNLRSANGNAFDPANYASFRTWILSATATNMAYMLSAQLAAMELNVFNGSVSGSALVYAPGAVGANAAGFITISALMAEANTELGVHGLTTTAGATRTYQEALKNALDRANNNLNFVQATPCAFSFATN